MKLDFYEKFTDTLIYVNFRSEKFYSNPTSILWDLEFSLKDIQKAVKFSVSLYIF